MKRMKLLYMSLEVICFPSTSYNEIEESKHPLTSSYKVLLPRKIEELTVFTVST